jgi:nicotinamidase-related amidase
MVKSLNQNWWSDYKRELERVLVRTISSCARRCTCEHMDDNLHYPLTSRTVLLCVDMQRLFSIDGPWPTPWMTRVLPVVTAMASRHPERTVFTRFIPPERPTDMPGMWQRYYTRWQSATREQLDVALLDIAPPLAKLCPPAQIIDKTRYSAFAEPHLAEHLQAREADGLILAGSETDVCVLATAIGAVDFGYRVIVVRDAVCSSSDKGHDAMMTLYHQRYTEQIEVTDAATILKHWEP